VVGGITMYATGDVTIEAADQLTLGIGANAYITVTSGNGVVMESSLTATNGNYNITGFNSISANTVSTTGNITGANLLLNVTQGLTTSNNTVILTSNLNNDVTGVHLTDGAQAVIYAAGNTYIQSDTGNNQYTWNFDSTGNLRVPSNTNYANIVYGNAGLRWEQAGSNTQVLLTTNVGDNINYLSMIDNGPMTVSSIENFNIITDANVALQTWQFDTTGNIILPGNTSSINYANGSPYGGSGSGSYGDSNVVTLLSAFGSNVISTSGNVNTGNIVTGTGTGGNITGVNIMSANVFIGDGGNLTNLPSSGLVVDSMTSGANITASVNDTQYNVTALAESATVTAPTGVAQDGQKLTYRIIDDGFPQALTWDPIYQVIGVTLPTTTVSSKYVYVGVIYNDQDTTWDVVSVAQQA